MELRNKKHLFIFEEKIKYNQHNSVKMFCIYVNSWFENY